jgi:hypothetical protein
MNWELVQGKASHTNNCMHWGTIISVIIYIYPMSIFSRQGLAFFSINRAEPLIIMNMAKENQINLVNSNQKEPISNQVKLRKSTFHTEERMAT